MAKLMSDHQIRRVPIVKQGCLVGIVSLGDVSREPEHKEGAEKALSNISQPGGNHTT